MSVFTFISRRLPAARAKKRLPISTQVAPKPPLWKPRHLRIKRRRWPIGLQKWRHPAVLPAPTPILPPSSAGLAIFISRRKLMRRPRRVYPFAGATTVALTARATSQTKARANPAGAVSPSGRATAMLKSRMQFAASTPLTARATAQTAARAAQTSNLSLTSRLTTMAKARAAATGVVGIVGRATAMAMARGTISTAGALVSLLSTGASMVKARGAMTGTVGLSGRATAQAKGQATLGSAAALAGRATAAFAGRVAAYVGTAALTGRATVQTKTRSVLSSSASFVATGILKAMVTARAAPTTTGLLSASGTIKAMVTGRAAQPTVRAAMTARAQAQAKGTAAPSGVVSLAARATAQSKASAALSQGIALIGRATAQAKARASSTARMALSGLVTAQTKATVAPRFVLSLAGRVSAQAKGSAVAQVISSLVAFSSVIRGMVTGRGQLTAQTPFVSMVGLLKSMLSARGTLTIVPGKVTPIGCVVYGRGSFAMILGRDCGCDGMNIHKPEWFNVGDTWQLQGMLTYGDGSPFNLNAGCVLKWQMQDSDGVNVGPELTLGDGIAVLDADAGICLITMLPSQSAEIPVGTYIDQLQATDPTGLVSTQWTGPIDVKVSFFAP